MREIIDSIWFNEVGMVSTKNETGEVKFYIGKARGCIQEDDEQCIADHGTKVNTEDVINFFKTNLQKDEKPNS